MPDDWTGHLEYSNARFSAGEITDFGDIAGEGEAVNRAPVIHPGTGDGVIEVSGSDAAGFLQGQLSVDVENLPANRARLATCNSPKGRVIAVMRVEGTAGGRFRLKLPAEIAPAVVQRLKMFVLRSDVELACPTPEHATLGLGGPDAGSLLEDLSLPVPVRVHANESEGGIGVRRIEGAARWELSGSPDRIKALWKKAGNNARPVGAIAWRGLDIEAGVPWVLPDSREKWLAQELNMDDLEAIDYRKGCYTGQEVIARLHHLGNRKRRLVRLETASSPPPPGTRVVSEDKTAGETVLGYAAGDHTVIAAVVRNQVLDEGSPLTLEPGGTVEPRDYDYDWFRT